MLSYKIVIRVTVTIKEALKNEHFYYFLRRCNVTLLMILGDNENSYLIVKHDYSGKNKKKRNTKNKIYYASIKIFRGLMIL